ncbi:MAG: MGMT family protein [Thermotogae bacterium]|nr:MGMT family protein [Thermotogota bacterium]
MPLVFPGGRLYAYAAGDMALYVGARPLRGMRESRELLKELEEYLSGRRREFSFTPDFSIYPTTLRRILLYIYRELPYGSTATYGEVASAVGTHPRVVGMAMARNSHLILIPCHRVVGSGGLGGFSLGLEVKRFLLQLESAGGGT